MGRPPIHVRIKNVATKTQNRICAGGQKAEDFRFCVWVRGRINRTRIAANIHTTPPSLFGIDRKIAYAHRKYHSGLM